MNNNTWIYTILTGLTLYALYKIYIRLQLSMAKHPSLAGHAKISRKLAKLVPFYEYTASGFFASDGAPEQVQQQRRQGFNQLQQQFIEQSPNTIEASNALEESISDVQFTNAYRVPFQYRNYVRDNLKIGTLLTASSGTRVKDMDEQWSYDLSGSYGVNVFGYDFYKECIQCGIEKVGELGPVLGPYHPLIADNVNKIKQISGMDEVSFHMSGTEAVMQAVRLARYHTGKSHLVRFCGAYHGWWDGVQPGVGNGRNVSDVYTLRDMHPATLKVLRTRKDIACVLINPLQALHPNADASSDASLVNSGRSAHYDRDAYSQWLQKLRKVCSERGIVLIMDEVFVGFRLAYGGAQEYFNLRADMVVYGKTIGGGLPIGVVCGRHHLMKRFRDNHPTQVCLARGTFNSHPYVLGAMHEFLQRIEEPEIQKSYDILDELWNQRIAELNNQLQTKQLPIKIVNMSSIWTILYTQPGRYNWMFQYYLRANGLNISWVGSGRVIMSHNYSNEEFEDVIQRFVTAAATMQQDGWWWKNEHLTNKSIKRQILKEMAATRLGRKATAIK